MLCVGDECSLINETKISKNLENRNGKINIGRWTKEEHSLFVNEVLKNGIKNWKKVKQNY
jgi:hypothetical protein